MHSGNYLLFSVYHIITEVSSKGSKVVKHSLDIKGQLVIIKVSYISSEVNIVHDVSLKVFKCLLC